MGRVEGTSGTAHRRARPVRAARASSERMRPISSAGRSRSAWVMSTTIQPAARTRAARVTSRRNRSLSRWWSPWYSSTTFSSEDDVAAVARHRPADGRVADEPGDARGDEQQAQLGLLGALGAAVDEGERLSEERDAAPCRGCLDRGRELGRARVARVHEVVGCGDELAEGEDACEVDPRAHGRGAPHPVAAYEVAGEQPYAAADHVARAGRVPLGRHADVQRERVLATLSVGATRGGGGAGGGVRGRRGRPCGGCPRPGRRRRVRTRSAGNPTGRTPRPAPRRRRRGRG